MRARGGGRGWRSRARWGFEPSSPPHSLSLAPVSIGVSMLARSGRFGQCIHHGASCCISRRLPAPKCCASSCVLMACGRCVSPIMHLRSGLVGRSRWARARCRACHRGAALTPIGAPPELWGCSGAARALLGCRSCAARQPLGRRPSASAPLGPVARHPASGALGRPSGAQGSDLCKESNSPFSSACQRRVHGVVCCTRRSSARERRTPIGLALATGVHGRGFSLDLHSSSASVLGSVERWGLVTLVAEPAGATLARACPLSRATSIGRPERARPGTGRIRRVSRGDH